MFDTITRCFRCCWLAARRRARSGDEKLALWHAALARTDRSWGAGTFGIAANDSFLVGVNSDLRFADAGYIQIEAGTAPIANQIQVRRRRRRTHCVHPL